MSRSIGSIHNALVGGRGRWRVGRRTLATLILGVWAVTLGWLAQRHYLRGAVSDRVSRWPVPPGSAYHSIRLADRQYGLTSVTIDTLPEGLRVTELATVDLPIIQPSVNRRTSLRIEALYTRGLQLRNWRLDLLTEDGRRVGIGAVDGDTLLTVINVPGQEPPETLLVRLQRPVILPSAIPLVAASRGLPRPGSRLNLAVYDPVEDEMRIDRLTVAAESVFVVPDSAEFSETLRRWRVAHADTVRAWRIDGMEHGLPVSRWVDAAGMTVRVDHALGARIDRSAFEMVNTNYRALPPPLWDTGAAAPSLLPRTGSPAARRSLAVVARLAPEAPLPPGVPGLTGGWQWRSGDTLRAAPREGGDTIEAASVVEVRLEASPALVQAQARLIRAERRPEAVARILTDWVRRTITIRDGPGGSTATRVLARGSGTAEERVSLVVALTRAAGLTARRVWGLTFRAGRWQLAQWAEVHTGFGWMPFDPALPAGKAGVTGLRLATGGEPRLLDLVLRAGRLRLHLFGDSA
jgi:hypothetical protein